MASLMKLAWWPSRRAIPHTMSVSHGVELVSRRMFNWRSPIMSSRIIARSGFSVPVLRATST